MATSLAATKTQCYNLGPIDRVPLGEGRCFQINDISIAVFRTRAGGVFATQALCPHRAGPLADGLIGGTTLVCPLHAYRFDLATGQPLGNECAPLKTYPASVSESGDILLSPDGPGNP
jgi:nitrite reductase (NADH) small subunit